MFMEMIHRYAQNSTALSMLSGISKLRMDTKGGPLSRLPLEIFDRHMALWGTTGAGKSNVFEVLLKRFLPLVFKGEMSCIVVESSVLPDRIARYVDVVLGKADDPRIIWLDLQPDEDGGYDHLIEMNLFEIPKCYKGRVSTEKLSGLYSNICETLFNQPLSQHMKNVLNASINLMLSVGDPSVPLLVEILSDPGKFLDDPDVDIDDSTRSFIEDEIIGGSVAYKRQIADVRARIHSLTMTALTRRLFCSNEPTINLVDEVNKGAFLVAALRSGESSDDTASLIGRILVNIGKQISQSRRSAKGKRCVTIIDEVHNFFVKEDFPDLRSIHKESRKDRFGCCSGLQQPGDMGSDLFDTFMNCSGIQMAGKMKTRAAAKKIADDMGLSPEQIMDLVTGEFWLKVSDHYETAIKITVPPGSLGVWRTDAQREAMQEQARKSSEKMRRIMARRYSSAITKTARKAKARQRIKRGTFHPQIVRKAS